MDDKDVLEIIVHSNKKKFGKLCINLNEILSQEPKWFSFEVKIDESQHSTSRSIFDPDLPNSCSSFGTIG